MYYLILVNHKIVHPNGEPFSKDYKEFPTVRHLLAYMYLNFQDMSMISKDYPTKTARYNLENCFLCAYATRLIEAFVVNVKHKQVYKEYRGSGELHDYITQILRRGNIRDILL